MASKKKSEDTVVVPPVNKTPRIAIAGAGGIGAYFAQFLFDYGAVRNQLHFPVGEVVIFDDDTVDVSNLLHQNFTEDDLGKSKADIVAAKCFMKAEKRFMTEKDFPDYDVVFSCVDSMKFRKQLYEYSWKHPELYWVDGRCSSRNVGVFNSRLSEATLKKFVTDDEERRGCLLAVDKANKVSHATPIVVASTMLQVYLNHLRGEDTLTPVTLVI